MRQSSLKAMTVVIASIVAWSCGAYAIEVDEDAVMMRERAPSVRRSLPFERPPHQGLRRMTAEGYTLCAPFAAGVLFATALLNDKASLESRRHAYIERGICNRQYWIPSTIAPPVSVGKAIDDRRVVIITVEPVFDAFMALSAEGASNWYVVCWQTPHEKRCF